MIITFSLTFCFFCSLFALISDRIEGSLIRLDRNHQSPFDPDSQLQSTRPEGHLAAAIQAANCFWTVVTMDSRRLVEALISRIDNKRIPNDVFSSLYLMFMDVFYDALQLLDNQAFTLLYTSTGRQVFEVKGQENRTYYCFKNTYFCTCPSFQIKVLNKLETLMCKHVLASKLCEKLKACRYRQIDERFMIHILRGYGETDQEFALREQQNICN